MRKHGVNVNKCSIIAFESQKNYITYMYIQRGDAGSDCPYWLWTKHNPTLQGWWRLACYKTELIRQPQKNECSYFRCLCYCHTSCLMAAQLVLLHQSYVEMTVEWHYFGLIPNTLLDYEKVTIVIYCMHWDAHTHSQPPSSCPKSTQQVVICTQWVWPALFQYSAAMDSFEALRVN